MEPIQKSSELYPMRQAQFLKDGLTAMMDYLEQKYGPLKDKTIIEIGSYAGESSSMFAERFGLVVCVDPWIDDYDPNDATCYHAAMSIVEKAFDERMSSFDNFIKIKTTSDEASKLATDFNAELSDFIYIDGLHTYEQVSKDIDNFYDLLKTPKIYCGHDYSDNWMGVKTAINEKLGIPDAVFCDTSWVKKVE